MRLGTFALCLGFCVDALAGDADADAFVSCAARYATPLSHESQFDALRNVVGDARVVALGEPAHGAIAPLELRNRVIRYLVEHLGFTAIALETSFDQSRVVYDFVKTGTDALRASSVAREGLTWGFGKFPENAELIRWLHDYNANPAHKRKVQFYGIDLSGADNHGSFSRARAAIDHSLLVNFQAPEAISSAGRQQHEWARQELAVAQKLQEYLRAEPASAATDDQIPPDGYVQDEIRDAAMAENVRWVLQQEGPNGRVFVFAHDAHVMNAPLRGGIWSVYSRAPRAMGDFLRETMGDSLLIIGTVAATGASGSTEAVLGRVGVPPFLLDLRKAACSTSAAAWLAERRQIRTNYDTTLDVSLQSAFDAVVFLNEIERRK